MKRMGSANSSGSLTQDRQSDEVVKPFWRIITGYIDELFRLRQSEPVVLSSTSDTIGIGRPLYTDRMKRVWPRESVYENRGESDDGESNDQVKITKEATSVPHEDNVSVATSRRLLSEHSTITESPGSSCVTLDELRRRGVTMIQCHDMPRPLPPPPTEDGDIATSSDSTCSSLGPHDATMHEELVQSDMKDSSPSAGYTGECAEVGDSSSTAQYSHKQIKCRRNVVRPENHFPYSIQDSRHWNKTIVLTESGSRVAWTTRRVVHSLRMQRCGEPTLKRSTAIHPADISCDVIGNTPDTVNISQRLPDPNSRDSIEDSRPQDTRNELICCQLDEKHRTHSGTTSEYVLPGSSELQRTHTQKRHPIVSNILSMLGAETQDNKVSDAEQNAPNATLQTTTNIAKNNLRTRLFETSSPREEDTIAIYPHSELRSTSFKHVSSCSSVPEAVCHGTLSTVSERCKTRPTAPGDRIQIIQHTETPTGKTTRHLRRKVPLQIGRKTTADLVRFL